MLFEQTNRSVDKPSVSADDDSPCLCLKNLDYVIEIGSKKWFSTGEVHGTHLGKLIVDIDSHLIGWVRWIAPYVAHIAFGIASISADDTAEMDSIFAGIGRF